jgi:hypothetical protein
MAEYVEGYLRTNLKNLHESALKKIQWPFRRAGLHGAARDTQAQI